MGTQMEYRGKILEVIGESLGVDPSEIQSEGTFENVDIDSIEFIRLVVSLEQKLDIDFEDEMILLQRYESLDAFIDYTEGLCKKGTAASGQV